MDYFGPFLDNLKQSWIVSDNFGRFGTILSNSLEVPKRLGIPQICRIGWVAGTSQGESTFWISSAAQRVLTALGLERGSSCH